MTWVVFAVGVSTPVMAAHEGLQIGLATQPTFIATGFRLAVVVWAVVMLGAGAKLPRAVVATILMLVGLGLGFFSVGAVSIPLALVVAWLVVAVGMALYVVAPRLIMALAMTWPLPALYGVHLFLSGSFDRSLSLAVGLMLAGVVLGAIFPRRGLVLLSVATGTVLLFAAVPLDARVTKILSVAASGVLWQVFALKAWRPEGYRRWAGSRRRPARRDVWMSSVGWAAVVLAVGVVLVAFTAPIYDADGVVDRARLDVMAGSGELTRPGVVFGKLNNYYLSGKAFPLALVGEDAGPLMRLACPFTGRDVSGFIRDMRAVKSDTELAAMRRAAAITSAAFEDIRPLIRPEVSEADIDRAIRESFARNGATGIAFSGIVGSGANAVLPHYQKNDAEMTAGLVVIDIGSAVDGYASDMTRTFSVTGSYGEAERLLIETVISAGDAARAVLAPGATMKMVDQASRRVISDAGFGRFYTHSVGHHVGLNVHDPGRDPLEPGMVVTIEPGIYIPDGADVDAVYWNLGVRIEDTYVVTETGWEEITSYPRRPY